MLCFFNILVLQLHWWTNTLLCLMTTDVQKSI